MKNLLQFAFEKYSINMIHYFNAFLSGTWSISNPGSEVNVVSNFKFTYSSMPPYCEECKTTFEETVIREAVSQKKPVKCTKCGHYMPVRPANDEIKNFHPKAIGIINDSKGIDFNNNVKIKEKTTVVFNCMSCGAALKLSEDSNRLLKCQYCGNENYLPDIIWTKLHPYKDTEPIFLILDIDYDELKASLNYFSRKYGSLEVINCYIFTKHMRIFIANYFSNIFISDAVLNWWEIYLNRKTIADLYIPDLKVIEEDIRNEIIEFSKVSGIDYFYRFFCHYININPELKLYIATNVKNPPDYVKGMFLSDPDERIRNSVKKQ
ncbi:MAG: hypothetical protein NTU73_03510 [Ignavibacteriae bacterium]|nr:hypothetical protein [Ignavibacteriota bacterium]